MMMSDSQTLAILMPPELVHYWGWFLAFGIGLVALGVAAVARAFTATIASMLFFGWLLVIAAVIELVQAVMVGALGGLLPPFAGRDSVRGDGPVAGDATADQRRGFDLRDRHILPDRRAVRTGRIVRCRSSRLGLAGGGRGHHDYPRR